MKQLDLRSEIAAVQKAMDDSTDTSGAIREILLAVYLKGVKRGAVEGYDHGYGDGKREFDASRRKAVVDSVHSDATRHAAGVVSPRRSVRSEDAA